MTEPDDLSVEVRRGSPSAEELAALLAVVTEAYVREADTVVTDDVAGGSAWQSSARSLRAPLKRGLPWGRSGP